MNFFDRYSQVCKEQGIDPCSQATADRLGISRSTISSWNTKNTFPKGETVAAIADELGVSADYLLCRTDDPTDYSNPDLIAEVAGPVLDEFDGDVKSAVEFQRAVEADVAKEKQQLYMSITNMYLRLDEIDRAKAEAFMQGLLAADKYAETSIKKNA